MKVFIVSRRAIPITFSIHTSFHSVCRIDQTVPVLTLDNVVADDQLTYRLFHSLTYSKEGAVWKVRYVPSQRNSILFALVPLFIPSFYQSVASFSSWNLHFSFQHSSRRNCARFLYSLHSFPSFAFWRGLSILSCVLFI